MDGNLHQKNVEAVGVEPKKPLAVFIVHKNTQGLGRDIVKPDHGLGSPLRGGEIEQVGLLLGPDRIEVARHLITAESSQSRGIVIKGNYRREDNVTVADTPVLWVDIAAIRNYDATQLDPRTRLEVDLYESVPAITLKRFCGAIPRSRKKIAVVWIPFNSLSQFVLAGMAQIIGEYLCQFVWQ